MSAINPAGEHPSGTGRETRPKPNRNRARYDSFLAANRGVDARERGVRRIIADAAAGEFRIRKDRDTGKWFCTYEPEGEKPIYFEIGDLEDAERFADVVVAADGERWTWSPEGAEEFDDPNVV